MLDDAASFKTKEVSKQSASSTRSSTPREHPELYGEIDHKVTIHYYPPRGDNKEGWDAIDIFGWLGYPMQIKVNFQCRDSILAAPHRPRPRAPRRPRPARRGEGPAGVALVLLQEPGHRFRGAPPVHDLFQQQTMLQEYLRTLADRAAAETHGAVG